MGACGGYCTQGFSTTTRCNSGMIDNIDNEGHFPLHETLSFFQDLVNPLPKERWNSTAASCSSNTIGPLCSDVIEKN